MTYKMVFDREKCQGYANCLIEAPDIWDFDEQNDIAVLIEEFPPEEARARAEASVRGCPAHAVLLEEVTP